MVNEHSESAIYMLLYDFMTVSPKALDCESHTTLHA